ncbi:radical SAM protein [Candidatus Woesearchaeota archaeon]|nr:radical SAM protein [Candidatus Woesearchaeota archaeon]
MLAKLKYWFDEKKGAFSMWSAFLRYGTSSPKRNNSFDNLKLFLKHNISGINTVFLEASSICQLKCPVCPTGKGLTKNEAVGWGYLKFNNFKKFVDQNPNVKNIELSHWGEIFLNPELKEIIKYAYDKKINISASIGVNLNSVREDLIEDLVKYKFKHLLVSIDGASNDTYKIYRIGGDFDRVIKLNHTSSYSPINDKRLVRKFSEKGIVSREEFKQRYKHNYLNPCAQLWVSPFINWDGKLLGCCINRKVDFGNVFENGLKECLKSEKYVYAKNMVLGKVKPRGDMPCYNCRYYKNPERQNN